MYSLRNRSEASPREKPVQSPSDPFDFSEYSSSRDGIDTPSTTPSGPAWGSAPTFGSHPDPFGPGASSPAFASTDVFASEQPVRSSGFSQGKTPVGRVVAACAVAVVGLVLAIIALALGSVGFAVAGWALAGPIAALLLATYMIADTKQRALPVYQPSKAAQVIYWVTVACAAAGVLLGAWQIADWFGRL
ncbi:hypothetical protein JRB27_24215 [Rhodococcus sp. Rp3]|nr:hypothetical protein [Rhodococcus sp. Rp3]